MMVENVIKNEVNDGKLVWVGDKIYFLFDQSKNMCLNFWVYDIKNKFFKQIIKFKDFDIFFMLVGLDDFVFEVGGSLYFMDFVIEKYKVVNVNVISDLLVEMLQCKDVSRSIVNMIVFL